MAPFGIPSRLCLVLLAPLALASCTLSLNSKSSPSAPGVGGGGGSLAGAQAAFYANQYSKADAAYRNYIAANPSDPDGHADYALFLNYSRRFPEALAEAQTAVSFGPRSALAAAVNTRVHDWSASGIADLKATAQIGAGAVELGPKSALTHVFYSEALADSGDIANAQKEIDTSAGLASGAYEKSEVEREKANLALDQGDKQGQLAHLQAAEALMPGWAERTRELAEFYFGANDLAMASTEFQKAIAMAPTDVNLRVTLGGLALFQQDVSDAQAAFVTANQLKPHDPGIESTLAITTFASARDTAKTEQLLRAALADGPQSVPDAELLEGFLRYIKGDAAAADLVVVGKPPREPINPDAHFPVDVKSLRATTNQAALDAVNADRAKAHLAPVQLDARITEGATSHAYWWLFNLALPQVKGLGIHREVDGTPGFSGTTMRDRATTFGYPSASMAEDITHRDTPTAAISDWVDSVYHRFPIMVPGLNYIGFGAATGGGLPIEVMDMSFSNDSGDPNQQVVFPADGQTGVPNVFLGNELPDPVPAGGTYPTGYPITVNYNLRVAVQVRGSSLTDSIGNAVPAYTIAPNPGDENVFTILPKRPLSPGSIYRVRVDATAQGSAVSKTWSFTTAGTPAGASGGLQALARPEASMRPSLS